MTLDITLFDRTMTTSTPQALLDRASEIDRHREEVFARPPVAKTAAALLAAMNEYPAAGLELIDTQTDFYPEIHGWGSRNFVTWVQRRGRIRQMTMTATLHEELPMNEQLRIEREDESLRFARRVRQAVTLRIEKAAKAHPDELRRIRERRIRLEAIYKDEVTA